MTDRLAMFKAAKAQRGAAAGPTKEQLKALRAQKAKAAAEEAAAAVAREERERKHQTALAAATAAAAGRRQQERSQAGQTPSGGTMLPPAPRPRASAELLGPGSTGSNPAGDARAGETQLTRVGRNASIAPEPAGQSNASSGAVPLGVELAMSAKSDERSVGSLPAGFFDEPGTSGAERQESVGTGELIGSTADLSSEVASALGVRHGSVEAMSAQTAVAGVPADFFEAAGGTEEAGTAQPRTLAAEAPAAEPALADKPGALPTGFFENKEADAKARGIAPARKKTKEEEYADFMAAVSADVRDADARDQAEAVEAAEARSDREAFEQRIRLERLRRLKERQTDLPDVRELLQSEAEAPVLDAAALARPRKRRRNDSPGAGGGSGGAGSSASEDEDDDEDLELDWRAKGL